MRRKKIILNDHRIIVDEINYYYSKNIENKEKTQTDFRIYIEFTNRERLTLKYDSSESRDNALRALDHEFD
ncbi:MAG: hypothetical protein FWB73_03195 [Treponema sp.]|nr:hypothetical protein [Treponema sp.]